VARKFREKAEGKEGEADAAPGIRVAGVVRGGVEVSSVFGLGFAGEALFQEEDAEVESDVEEVPVELESASVGLVGVAGPSSGVVGETQAIPDLGFGGEFGGGQFKKSDGFLGTAGLKFAISLREGLRT
jgi:hypothetical protein